MKEYVMLESKKLFGSGKIIKILHNGNVYILRITKENKLILTK
jgi:hemin uptake protein HemP